MRGRAAINAPGGIEPYERVCAANWRRSLCAAKRRRPSKYAYMSGGYRIRPYANKKIWPRRGQSERGEKALRNVQHSCTF